MIGYIDSIAIYTVIIVLSYLTFYSTWSCNSMLPVDTHVCRLMLRVVTRAYPLLLMKDCYEVVTVVTYFSGIDYYLLFPGPPIPCYPLLLIIKILVTHCYPLLL